MDHADRVVERLLVHDQTRMTRAFEHLHQLPEGISRCTAMMSARGTITSSMRRSRSPECCAA